MGLNTKKLTDEEIQIYKEYLNKAEPYTQNEIDSIPLDSCNFDIDRMRAFNAKRALERAGLL